MSLVSFIQEKTFHAWGESSSLQAVELCFKGNCMQEFCFFVFPRHHLNRKPGSWFHGVLEETA